MAVISIQGKQYLVKDGDKIIVSHLDKEPGEVVMAKDMLSGQEMKLEVLGHKKGEKVKILKFRNKTRYKRNIGYRSLLTELKVGVEAKAEKADKEKAKDKPVKKTVKTAVKKEGK